MTVQTAKAASSKIRPRPPAKPTDKPLALPLANRYNIKASQLRTQQVQRSGGRGR
jgi:hypothetical protein